MMWGMIPGFRRRRHPDLQLDARSGRGGDHAERTRAIMVAHTLGNPFDAERIAAIAKRHNLWLIEDCCDALGATV